VSAEKDNLRIVGQKIPRVDSTSLVTGQPVFADDFTLPGILHAKILRSPHAHAKISTIDTSKAELVPGIRTVLTYKNVPGKIYTTAGQGYPEPSPYDTFMLDKKVRYVGDRVAVVAGETMEAVNEALSVIKVEYEILPAILDPRESINSPVIIHNEPEITGAHDPSRNIAAKIHMEIGDFHSAITNSKWEFHREYSVPYVQQCSLEPHVTISYMDEWNRLIIRTSTQVPFHVRRIVSRVLNFPISRIRVIKPRIGGGFGGKQEILNEEVCAYLTLLTRSPVRLEMTREEEFHAARTRHPQILKWSAGVDKDYRLKALSLEILENTGAYGAHSLTVMSVTGSKSLSLYRCDNIRFKATAVYTNLPVAGAYRGYGSPQGFFSLESFMDEIAHEIDIDPLEFRAINHVREGDPLPVLEKLGEGREGFPTKLYSCGLAECIEQGKQAVKWENKRKRPSEGIIKRGIGVALALQGSGIPGVDMGSAFIKMNEDGSFHLMVGATDLGTGSDTALAQIAAEVLSVPVKNIAVFSSDTDFTPFDPGAYASSTTYISGGAVKKAAEAVREKILEAATRFLNFPADRLRVENGMVVSPGGTGITYIDLCTRLFYTEHQEQIMAGASHISYDSPPPFNATFAEVEVDTETGFVKVLKIVSATDCGQVVNPQMAEGQVEGAIAQSLGYALSEWMIFDDQGRPLHLNFRDYHIFTAMDMPEIETILVSTHEPTGPFGAKAIAEIPVNGPAPAITNAIFNACGVRIRELPVTPEKILSGLEKKV
jgi:putative selenate reductase molybdopterin-binding subunit